MEVEEVEDSNDLIEKRFPNITVPRLSLSSSSSPSVVASFDSIRSIQIFFRCLGFCFPSRLYNRSRKPKTSEGIK